jgi:hypothetical protein
LALLPFASDRACITHVHSDFVERFPNALAGRRDELITGDEFAMF